MKFFKVCNSVIGYLDLLLYHRHTPGKVVVLPDLPGQFLNFGVCHCLGYLYGIFAFPGGYQAGDDYSHQGHTAGNQCHYDGFTHGYTPSSLPQVAGPTMPSAVIPCAFW